MAIAIKRILLVTRNVQFAIDSKRALEALGAYAVTTVTEARNAVEQLRRKPHHLVLLDVENLAVAPGVMIESIRARQGEIAVVLAPDTPRARELARDFGAQGVVDIPAPTRSLIPVLESSLKEIYEALPQTLKLPVVDLHDDTVEIEALVEEALGDDALPSYTLRRLQASYRLLNPDVEGVPSAAAAIDAVELVIEPQVDGESISYRRVRPVHAEDSVSGDESSERDEDTPLSEASEDSTVRDLGRALASNPLDPSDQYTTVPPASHEDDGALGTALREALAQDSTLDSLARLTLYDAKAVGASTNPEQKPHWAKESEKFVKEPGFLAEDLPALSSQAMPQQTTAPARFDRPDYDATTEAADFEFDGNDTKTPAAVDRSDVEEPLRSYEADPTVTQLAAIMTQMMTNLTAEATVLTRDNALIAFSGDMPPDALKSLREAIGEDWTAGENSARLRFVTVPGNGKDYMLYSKATVHNMTLSLIFAGDRSLSAISEQGDRLLRALAAEVDSAGSASDSTQDNESERSQAPGDNVFAAESSHLPYGFVWLTAEPVVQLNRALANQIVFWLEVQLNGLGWTLRRLDVYQEFIHLVAQVPASDPPEALIRALMERSARIIRSEDGSLPEELWADAYMVIQPGRELDARELRKFLQFARADRT